MKILDKTVSELKEIAKNKNLKGYSRLNKNELIELLNSSKKIKTGGEYNSYESEVTEEDVRKMEYILKFNGLPGRKTLSNEERSRYYYLIERFNLENEIFNLKIRIADLEDEIRTKETNKSKIKFNILKQSCNKAYPYTLYPSDEHKRCTMQRIPNDNNIRRTCPIIKSKECNQKTVLNKELEKYKTKLKEKREILEEKILDLKLLQKNIKSD